MHISFIRIIMHHTLHKTNNMLSKFLLFSPKQVKVASDANRSRINTRIQTGKLSEQPTSLSSDNRSRINTRSQQGNVHILSTIIPLRAVSTKDCSDSFLLSTATTESGVGLSCLGWHLKPISDYLSTFLPLQNAAYLVKNQYKPITSFKDRHEV